ncbi:MAG: PIG-L deacetylase family protein [Streptosporangiaceae bacterium]
MTGDQEPIASARAGAPARAMSGAATGVSPIDAPGTGEAIWQAWTGLGLLPEIDPDRWRSAVILAAHPDDEVLGAGGTIARLASKGCRLRLIAVTDGEASHPGHRDPAGLARRRAEETLAALKVLGAGSCEVIRLGLPDAGLTGRQDELAAAIAEWVRGFDMCLAPWDGDLHGDHEAVGRAVRQLGGPVCFYPVWMWHWARPADTRSPWTHALRVPLPVQISNLKQAAIACFGSQLEDRAPGLPPMLSPEFLAHFTRDYEVLFPVEARS